MIQLSNINFGFGEKRIFENVNFTIKGKDKLALIGRNGVGKTTLFKLITKEYELRQGAIDIPNNYKIAHLKQHRKSMQDKPIIDLVMASQMDLQSVEDQIQKVQEEINSRTDYESDSYLNLLNRITDLNELLIHSNPQEVRATAEKFLKGLGFKQTELTNNVNTFSGGWQMRVELAAILLQRPDLLLLDEPTNYLDIESIIWFEKYLQDFNGSFVIISHDRDFLDNTTHKTVELINARLHIYNQPYSKAQVERVERHEQLKAAYVNQQKVIAQKERTIERFRAKATKTSMAQSMEKQLAKMDRVEWKEESSAEMKIRFLPPPRSAEAVVKTENLTKAYDEKLVFSDVDLLITRGEKIALVGQNGQGKSTLVNIITKRIEGTNGKCDIGSKVNIGIFYQDQTNQLDGDMTVFDTISAACPAELRTKLRSILGGFLFSGDDIEKKVKVLSGGEKTRLCLSTLLLEPYNFLILDEPTNHLDIAAKAVLQEVLAKYEGTVLIVSHDRFFLRGLTTKTIEMRDQKLHTYLGDIDYFLQKRNADSFREFEAAKKNSKANIGQASTNAQKREDKSDLQVENQASKLNGAQRHEARTKHKELQKKLKYHERDMEKVQVKIDKKESEISDPDFYQSPNHKQVLKRHKELKKQLDELNGEWDVIAEEIMKIEELI